MSILSHQQSQQQIEGITIPLPVLSTHKNHNVLSNANKLHKPLSLKTFHALTHPLALDHQYFEYLRDNQNEKCAVVSIIGDQGSGKSFLIDSLITVDSGCISRGLSKLTGGLVNATQYDFQTQYNSNIHFMDSCGQISIDLLILLYYVSSIILLNINNFQAKTQYKHFLSQINLLKAKLKFSHKQFSKPQLVICFRDCEQSHVSDPKKFDKFIEEVQESDLFSEDIIVLHFPYPSKNCSCSDLPDIPLIQFSKNFLISIRYLADFLKKTPSKRIFSQELTFKLLPYILHILTLSLSSQKKHISSQLIWTDSIKQYCMDYYKLCTEEYKQNVQAIMNDDEPTIEIDLQRKLSTIKRKSKKKYIGYLSLKKTPLLEKYSYKIEQLINCKEQEVIDCNNHKIQTKNKQKIQQLQNSNISHTEMIDKYNQLQYEYGKSDRLIQTFETQDNYQIVREVQTAIKVQKNRNIIIQNIVTMSAEPDQEEQIQLMKIESDNQGKQNQLQKLKSQCKDKNISKEVQQQLAELDKQVKKMLNEIKQTENYRNTLIRLTQKVVSHQNKKVIDSHKNKEKKMCCYLM